MEISVTKSKTDDIKSGNHNESNQPYILAFRNSIRYKVTIAVLKKKRMFTATEIAEETGLPLKDVKEELESLNEIAIIYGVLDDTYQLML